MDGVGTEVRSATETIRFSFVSGQELLAWPLEKWVYNRDVDAKRVARICRLYEEQTRAGMKSLFLPLPITVCYLAGAAILVDGQHRLVALRQLSEQRPELMAGIELAVCEVGCVSEAEVEHTFMRINTGTPVPAAYYNQKVDELVSSFLAALAEQFPGAAAPPETKRPQRPSYNPRFVKDQMSSVTPFRDAAIDGALSVHDLMIIALKENAVEAVAAKSPSHRPGVTAGMYENAKKSGFYLGVRANWAGDVATRAAGEAAERS
jgi:hypothetical protein